MRATAPWTVRAYELMADGQWYEYEKLVLALMDTVPPGRAMREAEKDRIRQGNEARTRPRSPEYIMRSGARKIIKDMLRQTMERKNEHGTVYYRLRPSARESKETHPSERHRVGRASS